VNGHRQLDRERCELEVAADAHEQLVLKCMPQPRKDATHRRLTEKQPFAGARDIALAQQHVERDEQIQVELARIHGGR